MLKGIAKIITGQISQKRKSDREAKLYQDLMRHEARVGGTVFGKIPNGRRREFFCLDKHTWVWHEEWTDKNGKHQVLTTRYDIRPNGILKSQNGSHYQAVSYKEASNLYSAARQYQQKVNQEIYSFI